MQSAYEGFLETLTPDLRAIVQRRMRFVRAKRGQALLGRGGGSTEIYFILEGAFSVIVYSASGREVSLRSLVEGDTFGELAAVDGRPRSATVVAESDARVAVLSSDDFMRCIQASPDTAVWLSRLLASKVRDMTERIFELSALNVQARLHCELLRLAKRGGPADESLTIDPAPTHAELANRIGTHREAVTREMRALVEHNVIRAGRRTLEFVDIRRLEHFVGQAVGEVL